MRAQDNLEADAPLCGSRVWIAVPKRGAAAPIAVVSESVADLHAHLHHLGVAADDCLIGNGRLASAEFSLDWDRVVYQAFG